MNWPEIWFGESLSSKAIRAILTPASWLYSLGWRVYVMTYGLGLKKPSRPHSPVICVGNFTVGGSGKTPVTIFVAQFLRSKGHRVVISASGYGSPASEAASVAPEGPLDPARWGDEPALLREELPDVPIIVGRRRVLAAEICQREFPDAILLMDDGLQHLPLARDLNLVIDPPRPNRRCLPAGPYREPPTEFPAFRGKVVLLPGDLQIEYSDLEFSDRKPPKAHVLCAIGNPAGFVSAVRDAGVELGTVMALGDHDPLNADVFADLDPTLPVIVTTKDSVKLRGRTGLPEIIVARRTCRIEPLTQLENLLSEVIA